MIAVYETPAYRPPRLVSSPAREETAAKAWQELLMAGAPRALLVRFGGSEAILKSRKNGTYFQQFFSKPINVDAGWRRIEINSGRNDAADHRRFCLRLIDEQFRPLSGETFQEIQ